MLLDDIIETGKFVIHDVEFATVDKNWSSIVSFYPYYRLYYITDSDAVLVLREKELPLLAGNLYFIPSFQVTDGRCNHLSHYYLHFSPELTVNNIIEYYKPTECVKADGSEAMLFETMIDAKKKDTPWSKLALHSAFKLILSRFFNSKDTNKKNILRFMPTLEYIESNIRRKITLPQLAATLNLEQVYFANIFKQSFQISPLQYVIGKKIDLARVMLATGNLSIKEIAFALGFDNELYFSRLFKQKTSFTPSYYRKNAEKLRT